MPSVPRRHHPFFAFRLALLTLAACRPAPYDWGRIIIVESRLGPSSWTVAAEDQGQGLELRVDGAVREAQCRRGAGVMRCWASGLRPGFHRLELFVPGRGVSRRTALAHRRPLGDEVVYEVLVDRFRDGDPRGNLRVDRDDPAAPHGGDLVGLRERLGHLVDLGVTTLLLSPVWEPERRSDRLGGVPAYLGLVPRAPEGLAASLGRPHDLLRLLGAARERGIRVLLDLPRGDLSLARYWSVVRTWVGRTFVDGVRVGPVRSGEARAWATATRSLAQDFAPLWLVHHGPEADRAVSGLPAEVAHRSTDQAGSALVEWLGGAASASVPGVRPHEVRGLSSHARPRLAARFPPAGSSGLADLALTAHLLLAGVPVVYYADGLDEADAPAAGRHPDVPWATVAAGERHRQLRRLVALRQGTPALARGGQSVTAEGDVLLVARRSGRCRVLVALNRADRPARLDLDLRRFGWADGIRAEIELVDGLRGRGHTATDGRLTLSLDGRSAAALVAADPGACRD